MKFDGPQELTTDEAILRLVNAAEAPGAQRGLRWYLVARALYAEVLRLRGEKHAAHAPPASEEEQIEAFNAAHAAAPRIPFEFCSLSSKRCYASESAALQASRGLPHGLRTYFCDACRGWHVTKAHR